MRACIHLRKDRVAHAIYSIALILVISDPAILLFPSTDEAYDAVLGDAEVDVTLDDSVRPIIRHLEKIDKDFDGIHDNLEAMVSQTIADGSDVLPIVVTLYSPVRSRDLDWFSMLGGQVTYVYHYVTYGFAGSIPASNISSFASLEGENLCVIEYDAPVRYHLDTSAHLIRARPIVWDTLGYTGSPNHSIAIIDTGIDDSHPDVGPFGDLNFSRKIVGWYDATGDMSATPEDYAEHGTHVAGIAAGTGDANSLQTSGLATTTWSGDLTGVPWSYGYLHHGFDTLNPELITLTCMWTSGNTIVLQLRDETGSSVLAEKSGKGKPLVLTYDAPESGRYRPFVGIGGFPPQDGLGYFSLRQTVPYQGREDGYNLFSGVAPSSKLVGVKVFDNTGFASSSTVYGGMDWVIANKHTYNITVASMSLSLENGATDTTFDQKADTMVENGIVTCVSAGNDYPYYTIGSPGTAAYVITVAATNDQNDITFYSSNGDQSKNEYGLVKPDVAAPGGSTEVGNLIISADSNDVDYEYSGQSDYTPDDYQQMMGTSMSTPHVSGLVALMIDALSSWNWTKEEALKVKMIISMTAFEVQGGESTNEPLLNRGDKDSKEGYGRICADAALEAVTMTYGVGERVNDTLGSGSSDKKVWARQVPLESETDYEFSLAVPPEADYDLYLYDGQPDSYGQPVVLGKSVNTSIGADETLEYTPTDSGLYYIVVKWVSGSGVFNLESTPRHDVAIVSVSPSTTQVYAGEMVNITVIAENEGTSAETFNVTAKYDNTTIATQTVFDLAPSANATLTFIWNTTDITPCINHTIAAQASLVQGEVDVFDNAYTDGQIRIRSQLIGDVNKDGTVDITDLAEIARAYGVGPDDPLYEPRLDLDNNDFINIIDLAMAGRNYGKSACD